MEYQKLPYETHQSERPLLIAKIIVTFIFWMLIIFWIKQSSNRLNSPPSTQFLIFVFYGVFILVYFFIQKAILVGHLAGNGIRLTEKQFPEAYAMVKEISERLGLDKAPPVYVLQGGGVLNAFATRHIGSDYVAVYSSLFETLENSPEALKFVLSHELGHVARMHSSIAFWTLPSMLIPFLHPAYSRACEYTCDKIGYAITPEGAKIGVLILAAGSTLFQKVDVDEYLDTFAKEDRDNGAVQLAEIFASHPHIPKRISALTETDNSKSV